MLAVMSICAASFAQDLPLVTVTKDDTVITESCRLAVPKGLFIQDANNNGVIHVRADGITIECVDDHGAELIRDELVGDWDKKTGIGYMIDGYKNVTIKKAHAHRYKCNIFARNADGLTLIDCDVSEGFAQRLGSTPEAEDGADWLSPHHNDKNEWLDRYGAAIYIEDSADVTIAGCYARRIQNGIVLDNVTRAKVYDCDFSFLSGWGLAMWRVTESVISRNAFDFCIRGYSHGVYNRGQDSAGILMFEQCSRNQFLGNSCTHGGDGIFGFAGREAIGEAPKPDFDYRRAGNSDNLFLGNDLSYAAAHGLEMTFSTGNRILDNRFVQNAICGIWGGFSNDTLIADNVFEANGGMAYGLERGGINIEHGSGNHILGNRFSANACGVHLWWRDNPGLLKLPGVAANERGVSDNVIAGNTFTADTLAIHLRDAAKGQKVRGTVFAANALNNVKKDRDVGEGIAVIEQAEAPSYAVPLAPPPGKRRPVGARSALAGRENIIMTEWGPWEHEGPLARLVSSRGGRHTYEFRNIDPATVTAVGIGLRFETSAGATRKLWTGTVAPASPGVLAYTIRMTQPDIAGDIMGTILATTWDVALFPWTRGPDSNLPADADPWETAFTSPTAARARVSDLTFNFGGRGPSDLGIAPAITAAKLPRDHFGIVATASIPLPAGKWRLTTVSDDGIRAYADGRRIIDNWTWHAAATDSAEFTTTADKPVDLRIEYFEIDGGAVLEVRIERVPD